MKKIFLITTSSPQQLRTTAHRSASVKFCKGIFHTMKSNSNAALDAALLDAAVNNDAAVNDDAPVEVKDGGAATGGPHL